MQEEAKTIEEVFKDYETVGEIQKAKILKVNIYKKTNKLVIQLFSTQYIPIKELLAFEKYLMARFLIENVIIQMQYAQEVEIPNIQSEWKNIMAYMAHKYPLTRVLLQKSKIEIEENNLSVILPVKGADFLQARGFDKILEDTLKNLYSQNYKVNYIEQLQEETIQEIARKSKLTEKFAIEKASQELQEMAEEAKEEQKQKEELPPLPEKGLPPMPEVEEEKSPVIIGRNGNIKEEIVKVEDISIDSGKIALEVVNF